MLDILLLQVFDIIVDVGSGSGNVTKQLSHRISHNRLIAIDIDPHMTEFAQNNYSSDTIEYITEDISKPWDKLCPKLKELEGKVSLVFSNRVLHWVEDKETVAKNISKLLAIGGDVCINVSAIQDLSPYLSDDFNANFIKIPSIEEQFNIWRKLLTNNGIELLFENNFFAETYYDRNTILVLWPTIPKQFKIYVKSKDHKVREQVTSDLTFKNVVYDSTFCWKKEFKANSYQDFMNSQEKGIALPYAQFRYIGKKS